jgi:hypothetical protein
VLGLENAGGEDNDWYGSSKFRSNDIIHYPLSIIHYPTGGYSITHDHDTLTFVRCGAYKDRPFQADNLHLDIWVNGQNLLRDAGSYKYNTDDKWVNYFA